MKHARTASIILLLILALAASVHAELNPARIVIGTREAIVSPQAVNDGTRVLAPLNLLDVLGVTYTKDASGKITVTNALGKSGDVDVTSLNGTTMVVVSKLAEVVGLGCSWDEDKRTLMLTAKIESVEFAEGVLKVNCTIPVSYKVTSWDTGAKLILDVNCATVGTPTSEIAVESPLVTRVRLGQPDETTARVVLDLAKAVSYRMDGPPVSANIKMAVSERTGPVVTPAAPKPQPQTAKPFDISGIKIVPLDDLRFQVVMNTSAKGAVSPSFAAKPAKVTLAMSNCTLEDSATSYSGSHPLLKDVRITQDPATHKARVELSLERTMIYETRVGENSITVMVMPPSKSGGTLADKVILIDPGHGGPKYGKIDPGARFGSLAEKDVNLAIGKELAAALEAQGAKVIMSRTADNGLGLSERPALARSSGADFFISIHCNSNGSSNSATGIETYYHMYDPSPKLLAESIHDNVCLTTGMCDRKARSDKSLYDTGLAVLRGLEGSGIPGILLECGYLNHAEDRARLTDSAQRKKLAQGIVAGFKDYVEGK